MTDDGTSPLEFPCDFPVKAFGRDTGDFDAVVVELVRGHAPGVHIESVAMRNSSRGRYVSVTVNLRAFNREQLDAIYRALTADDRVLFAL